MMKLTFVYDVGMDESWIIAEIVRACGRTIGGCQCDGIRWDFIPSSNTSGNSGGQSGSVADLRYRDTVLVSAVVFNV